MEHFRKCKEKETVKINSVFNSVFGSFVPVMNNERRHI